MIRTAVLSLLGLVVGLSSNVANAQFIYSSVGYVRPVYVAPVVVSRPVYVSPVVQTVYSAPVYTAPVYTTPVYASPISTVSYSVPTPVYSEPTVSYVSSSYYQPAPVYVSPAPVVVSRAVYSPAVVRESLTVRPFSSTYRAVGHNWGSGYSVYGRSGPFHTVVRARGW